MKSESFIDDSELAKMKQVEIDHPATERTNAGGWCKYCGCGNDVLGYKHLGACNRPLLGSVGTPPK
jgi:hypothetical protein